jgi:hypothetical protein
VIVFGFENKIYLVPVALALIAMMVAGFKEGAAGPGKFGNAGSPGLLGHRQTWSFFVGKLMTDGIWWFYLFWLPDYLVKQFHMKIHDTMWPTFIVYGVSIVGSVYGGSIPMTLMKRGMPVYKARMTAMFLIALCPLAVLTTQYFGDVSRFGDMAKVCVGAAGGRAAVAGPVGVEELAARLVHALVGVRAEIIALPGAGSPAAVRCGSRRKTPAPC